MALYFVPTNQNEGNILGGKAAGQTDLESLWVLHKWGIVCSLSEASQDTLENSFETDEDMSGDGVAVTTVGRDDFFNDPFFKDWWADFDLPLAGAGRQLNRQISGKKMV